METLNTVHIIAKGRVQGVGFRFYTSRLAESVGLKGYVKNLRDGNVEIEVEGDRQTIEIFIEKIKNGAMSSYIKDLDIKWSWCQNKYDGFDIKF